MSEYPKINNLFKRDDKTKNLIEDQISKECFSNINKWEVTEKIDGTNIRIIITPDEVKLSGRTDAAQLHVTLLDYLFKTFTKEKINEVFSSEKYGQIIDNIVIYGEGYGPKIQEPHGSLYSSKVGFVLFDLRVGRWWLERDSLERLAEKFNIPIVPLLEIPYSNFDNHLNSIVDCIKSEPLSIFSERKQVMEGVICKTPYFDRDGSRIMFKLKCKDFKK